MKGLPYLLLFLQKYYLLTLATYDTTHTAWREALLKDKPTGLQLYDGDGSVQRAYFASSIPRFVLINKKGEIDSFDAPAPSSGKEIEGLLQKEVENQAAIGLYRLTYIG
jgi:hypothetical protein